MRSTDQLGRKINVVYPPRKIISLVPSQSELLWHLGLREQLAGITKFCIHPDEMFRSITRVGGTKQIDFEKIKNLQPDLIIANKEENEREQIEELCIQYPVWISDIYNLEDAYAMMLGLGNLTGREKEAHTLVQQIRQKHSAFKATVHTEFSQVQQKTVAYLIWKNPYMAAGAETFIDFMLEECGFRNVFSKPKSRYPEITVQMLAEKKPEFIFLSSEPYPFREKHVAELKEHLPFSKIILVDGEMFSWHGSRLLYAFDYFKDLLASAGQRSA